MPQTDEKTLVELAKTDSQAFAMLYDRYVDHIHSFVYRQSGDAMLADEITSITFEKALKNIRRFRWRGVSFGAWLYRIARNEIAQYHRSHKPTTQLMEWQASDISVERIALQNEQRSTLHLALSRLSSKDRELISLRFFEDLPSDQVAEILNCSVQNVYTRLHRALKRLRSQLDQVESVSEEETRYVTK